MYFVTRKKKFPFFKRETVKSGSDDGTGHACPLKARETEKSSRKSSLDLFSTSSGVILIDFSIDFLRSLLMQSNDSGESGAKIRQTLSGEAKNDWKSFSVTLKS
jgi:hypothetical protein